MVRLPSISGREVVKAFEAAGFTVARTEGSHRIMTKRGHVLLLSVPVHQGKNVKPGTLRTLIRAAGLTVEQFLDYHFGRIPPTDKT